MAPTKFDTDNDGVASLAEMNAVERRLRIENEDKKQDAQRHMVWVALSGMLLYPALVLITSFIGSDPALSVLGSIAPTFFVSISAVVAAYYAKEGYVQSRMDINTIHVDQEI